MPQLNILGAIHRPLGPEMLVGGTANSATAAHQIIILPGHQSTEGRSAGLVLLVVILAGGQDWMKWTWQDHRQAAQHRQEGREKPPGPLTGSAPLRTLKCGGRTPESGSDRTTALIVQMSKLDSSLSRRHSSRGSTSLLISTRRARFRNTVFVPALSRCL